MGGPHLLRTVADARGDVPTQVPDEIDGRDVATGLDRFLDALSDAGSLRLRTDIERHRVLLLSLPGLDLTDFEAIDVAG